MENPPNFIVTPIAAPVSAEFTKLTFRSLYIRRTGPGSREIVMDGESDLGKRYISDFPVYDDDTSAANLVARVQGHSIQVGNTYQMFTIIFETESLKGSTLLTSGVLTMLSGTNEWAIYGGTGVFAMATGVIKRKALPDRIGDNSDELTIEVYVPKMHGPVTKRGLWGGPGGTQQDITVPPRRLQSVTIRSSGDAIDAIGFTYIDKYYQKHIVGPWGGTGGVPDTIDLDDAEYVKEVSGTYNLFEESIVLTSFKLVTNVRTLPHWGIEFGKPFHVTAQTNSSIVGFYGRAGTHVDAIGVYIA